MEARARVIVVIFILSSSALAPLASASFAKAVYEFFNPPVKPSIEPWMISDDSVKPKQPPKKRLGILYPLIKRPLREGFYDDSCPRAEQIVMDVIAKAVLNQSDVPARLLHLHFHDCFVKGCDASILLNTTPSGERTERQAFPNFTVKGFEIIDAVKSELEKECPGVVSCADAITFATRDALVLSGLPRYIVRGGRRDSKASLEADVQDNIPDAADPLNKTIKVFERKGLTVEDMVVLTGGHSIGEAHCRNFAYRLEKPNGSHNIDPKLVSEIKATCPTNTTRATLGMDRDTRYKMDAGFYKQLLEKKGLLESDVIMVDDSRTINYVKEMAVDQDSWFEKFVTSMTRMGSIGVLTGAEGEIRKNCAVVN